MGRGRSIAVFALSALAVVLLVIGVVLFLFTATDWGRERARLFALRQIRSAVNGEVELARVEGNLLDGVRLVDVSVTDSAGRPFVRADTLEFKYSLRALVSKQIRLSDLVLVNAEVVLNRPPGEDWNFVSIFRSDPPDDPSAPSAWGQWVELHDVTFQNSRVTMRTEWEPPPDLSPAEEEEAIRVALAGEIRDRVVEVPGGYQSVMDFRELDAEISRVLVSHPDTNAIPVDVTRFSGIAEPFNPPAADVRDLSGNFRLEGDTLFFRNVAARLPESRMTADGFYALEHADLSLSLDAENVALNDLRWFNPGLPEEGGGSLAVNVRLRPLYRRIVAREMDLRIGDAALHGRLDVRLGDTVHVQDTDLRFARVDTRLIEQLAPSLSIPRHGEVTGSIRLDGQPSDMLLDADFRFDDYAGGESRVLASGQAGAEDGIRFRDLRVQLRPLQAELVRAVAPDLPIRGAIEGNANLTGSLGGRMDLESALVLHDPQTGVSRVTAAGGVVFGKPLRLHDMRMRLEPFQLDLLRPYAPDVPTGATASGPVRVNGPVDGLLQIDSELTIDDPISGVSRIAARGGIDFRGNLRLQAMNLRLSPLQTSLVTSAAPDFPIGGILEGTATVSGSPSAQLAVQADLVHVEGGKRSHVTGAGEVAMAPDVRVDLALQLDPLSLNALGRLAPDAGLHGYTEGDLTVAGALADLQLDAALRFENGGVLEADGRFDLSSTDKAYDLNLALRDFDPSAVSERVPATGALTGTANAEGRGFDPATMEAALAADFEGVAVDGYETDELHLRLAVADGLATVAPSSIRLRTAEAQIEGSFGLVPKVEGVLAYRVTVDSLNLFAPWIPEADTGMVGPRPAVRDAALADAESAAREARVAFLATGQVPEPDPEREGPLVLYLPRDSLAGRLEASGTIRGNIDRFDADGHAVAERFIYRGNYVEHGNVVYTLADVGSGELDATIDASFESLLLGGYAFASAELDASYRGGQFGTGLVALAVNRDESSDLRLASEFSLAPERNELRLLELDVRVDTVQWSTTGPAVIAWREGGMTADDVELQSSGGGRVYMDGDLSVGGAADLELVITDLEIATVANLLQDDRMASGLLSLEASVQGTPQDPRLEGEATLRDAVVDGQDVPEVHALFGYADDELHADATLATDSLQLATMQARIPVHLAFGDGGPRLLDSAMQIDLRAERLPLDALPMFTGQVEAVEGVVAADLSITGTPDNPVLEGDVALDLASLRLVPLGVRFEPVIGHARMSGGILTIDSLIAYGDGPARVTGTVALESLTEPVFDLALEARNARIIDTEDAQLQVDADLTLRGPLESVEVAGLVRTRRGVIYVPEMSEFGPAEVVDLDDPSLSDRVDSLLLAQRDVVTQHSPIFENLQATVQVEIDRDVWLRSTEANVEIYTPTDAGPLRVRMTGLRGLPTIEGTINTDRGEYEYLSRRFTLTRGSVTFLGGEEIDPLLQLAAEHEVRIPGREALAIRIVVGGTLRDLEITFESNAQPPISQSDLLSFLAFGRETSTLIQGHGSSISGQSSGGSGLVGNVAGIASQQFTAIALESMLSGVEADIGQGLGLDVIRITPAHLSGDVFTGSYLDVLRGTEIEAGKYMGPRLFVAAQARPARAVPGVRLEYRTRREFEWSASWRTRFLPGTPTLSDPQADPVGVFGSFLFKEWRF